MINPVSLLASAHGGLSQVSEKDVARALSRQVINGANQDNLDLVIEGAAYDLSTEYNTVEETRLFAETIRNHFQSMMGAK